MSDYTDRTIAAEREAHYDGDRWRSYCAAQEYVRPALPPCATLLDPATCPHQSRAIYGGSLGVICLQCEATLTGKDAEPWGHLGK